MNLNHKVNKIRKIIMLAFVSMSQMLRKSHVCDTSGFDEYTTLSFCFIYGTTSFFEKKNPFVTSLSQVLILSRDK